VLEIGLAPFSDRQLRFLKIESMNPTTISTAQDISEMNVECLWQELNRRGLPTDGLKPALAERLQQAIQQEAGEEKKISNEGFRSAHPRKQS
jgi:hypothetical protein